MNKAYLKQTLYLFILITSISFVSAGNTTVNDLIDSFNYSYSNSSINILNKYDYMSDRNSNSINDTLVINLSTSVAGDGAFNFVVNLIDNGVPIINTTSKLMTGSDSFVQINFPTELLQSSKFNYTIEISNINDELVYREYKTETNTYLTYEKGLNITKIRDENLNNDLIRINLTINSTQTITTNITVTLDYNSSTISKTRETSLTNGVQVISIDFYNETIKSTHYVGNFTIDSVVVANKIFDLNQNTSIYNYEDFAKTSYIKSIADGRIDTNANNLSEFLEINFTVNVKEANTYNLTYDLYDQFDNFVISINKTQTLGLGNQTVQTLINGSEIYKTKINGPYVLSFVKLAVGNDTKDIIFDAHTTNQSFYTDYERPLLPDLRVQMSVMFNSITNITNITVNISNIGKASAFNVFLDIFDNTTYSNNRSLSFMDVNENVTYVFNITNSSNTSLYTSIVDFDNLVDESDESNNIAQNSQSQIVSLDIESITVMHSNDTLKIFEFVILNDGESTVTNVQWQFDTKDNNIINSTSNISSLAVGERAFVYLQYNFSNFGSYNVTANATGITASASLSSAISIGDLIITSFNNVNTNDTRVIFEIQAKNNLAENLNNVNWSLATGDGTIINSTSSFNLASNEVIFIYVQHDYGTTGTFNPIATVTNMTYTDTESASVQINASSSSNPTIKQATDFKGVIVLINSTTRSYFQKWNYSSGFDGMNNGTFTNLTTDGDTNLRTLTGDYSRISDIGILTYHTGVISRTVTVNTSTGASLSNLTVWDSPNSGGWRSAVMFLRNSARAILIYERGYSGEYGLRLFYGQNRSFGQEAVLLLPQNQSVLNSPRMRQRTNSNETMILMEGGGDNQYYASIAFINLTNYSAEGFRPYYNLTFAMSKEGRMINMSSLSNAQGNSMAAAWTDNGTGAIITMWNMSGSSSLGFGVAPPGNITAFYFNSSTQNITNANAFYPFRGMAGANVSAIVDSEACTMKGFNNKAFFAFMLRNGSNTAFMPAVISDNGTAETGFPRKDSNALGDVNNGVRYVGCYDSAFTDLVWFWWVSGDLGNGEDRKLKYGWYNKTSQSWFNSNLETAMNYTTLNVVNNALYTVKKTDCPEPDCFALSFQDNNGQIWGNAIFNGTNISAAKNVLIDDIGTFAAGDSFQFLFAPNMTV